MSKCINCGYQKFAHEMPHGDECEGIKNGFKEIRKFCNKYHCYLEYIKADTEGEADCRYECEGCMYSEIVPLYNGWM